MTITIDHQRTKPATRQAPRMLWLDLTRKCQLACSHCYNDSGPEGTHGTMTRADWDRVLDQAAALGVEHIQLIGGEPTLHPDALHLVDHALALGLQVEIFSNLVSIPAPWWERLDRPGVSVATSYYSGDASEHNTVTGRPTHARTRANIQTAVDRGIPIRVGIIDTGDPGRVEAARRDLETIGVDRIRVDRVRPYGRAATGPGLDPAGLCGQCGSGRAAIGPDGAVSPCVISAWMSVGNVHTDGLADILAGTAMAEANTQIRAASRTGKCDPDGECSPGFPGSGCSPRTA
ncbi:hypothetical protein Acsp03_62010 [Actinomadura sp. NBRC 104412]|uniref:radical SAM protein n=1 Tax=Actinomadura sp. NBRC 104412 TaxID=3032203 RepID=UPI0024A39F40|nr:radical SAM protein [Actinomadura sp. NBRC 104412]GLZ08735.1 hypothetical protein Acsp03_62010 [Actinomadura sp. NBRC 104412]